MEILGRSIRNYPHSRPEIDLSDQGGEDCESVLETTIEDDTPRVLAEERRTAALKVAEEFLRENLLPVDKALAAQLIRQKPQEDPRLLLKFLLLLESNDDSETAVKLWPKLLVELQACELRATRDKAVNRRPRKVRTTIKRDLEWLKEFNKSFAIMKGGGVAAFAKCLKVARDTLSKALTRARRELNRRKETKNKLRES